MLIPYRRGGPSSCRVLALETTHTDAELSSYRPQIPPGFSPILRKPSPQLWRDQVGGRPNLPRSRLLASTSLHLRTTPRTHPPPPARKPPVASNFAAPSRCAALVSAVAGLTATPPPRPCYLD